MSYCCVCEIESIVDCCRENGVKEGDECVVGMYYHWRERRPC